MNIIKRIRYALHLMRGNSQHLSITIVKKDGRTMLDVMAKIEDNDTLLLMSPYLQAIVYQAQGWDNWDVN